MILLLIVTAILGTTATLYAGWLAAYFMHSKEGIGRAVAYMLLGEAAGCLTITFFAWCHLLGVIDNVPPLVSAGLRIAAFTAAIASTVHLAYQVRRIQGKGG